MVTKRKRRKRPRYPVPEGSVTALLMRASEQQSEGPYPLLSRDWLASADRFDDPAARELADKLIAAYAAEHPPRPNAEAIADAVDWKVLLRGLNLAKQHGVLSDETRHELLAQARREVAEEIGKKPGAVKSDHVRARRKRVKCCPR